ncbi:MAG: UrcA family protein, partial [Hyphomonadaceae bacterium]|nr:UrcA family protein [Hyphomonadaceae bacterium]
MIRLGASLLAACVVMVLSSGEASGDTLPESEHMRVAYADLDLNSDAGAGMLMRRIESAAERVCDFDYIERAPQRRSAARTCMRDAIESAVRQVDSARLQAMYASGGAPALTRREVTLGDASG